MKPRMPEMPHAIHCTFEMGAFARQHLENAKREKTDYSADWQAKFEEAQAQNGGLTREEFADNTGQSLPERFIASEFSAQITTVNEAVMNLIKMLLVKYQGRDAPELTKVTLFDMALGEVLMNSGMHACEGIPEDGVAVRLSLYINENKDAIILVGVIDNGPKFKLEDIPDCTAEENLERTSGRGTEYMMNFTDEAYVNVDASEFIEPNGESPDRGNVVILLSHIVHEDVMRAQETREANEQAEKEAKLSAKEAQATAVTM